MGLWNGLKNRFIYLFIYYLNETSNLLDIHFLIILLDMEQLEFCQIWLMNLHDSASVVKDDRDFD